MQNFNTNDIKTLRRVFDSLPDAAFLVDTDWRIRLINRRAQSILNLTESDVSGRICQHALNADACAEFCPLAITLKSGHNQYDHRVTIRRSDGIPITVSVSTSLYQNEKGEALGGVVTFRNLTLQDETESTTDSTAEFCGMIGTTHAMRQLFKQVVALRKSRATVLIRGESGTGKERLARAIHKNSPACDGPFLAISCGAIPDTLLESELFGHRKGAFTDAKSNHSGYFERASGGTLFLDEIGEASSLLQIKLLRVLEEQRVTPVGGEQSFPVNVRVVAASHRDLATLVEDGVFRSDLYHRLSVVPLAIPPLSERLDDIPLLAKFFLLRSFNRKETDFSEISDAAIERLRDYDWPGNIRQLENAIAYACAIGEGKTLEDTHLPPYLTENLSDRSKLVKEGIDAGVNPILLALLKTDNKVGEAAKLLGISRVTFWRRLKALQASQLHTNDEHESKGIASISDITGCPEEVTNALPV